MGIEINGNIWSGTSPLYILFFIIAVMVCSYILGFYLGMQLEKSNENDRKAFEQQKKKKR
jgi:hypothetical protein